MSGSAATTVLSPPHSVTVRASSPSLSSLSPHSARENSLANLPNSLSSMPTSSASSAAAAVSSSNSSADGKKEVPVCATCNQVITTVQFIRVGSYKFHKDHFQCSACQTQLHGKKFHHKEGKFYCSDCYVNKFCHTCRACKQKITTGSFIHAFDNYFHPEHFVCVICRQPFQNGKYFEHENSAYCEEHYYALSSEKCAQCSKGIKEEDVVRVQGKAYHHACLSCHFCGQSLAGNKSIFSKENAVYCIAAGAQVALADGTAVRIEDTIQNLRKNGGPLIAFNEKRSGLDACQQMHFHVRGQQECVELMLDDGRTLICTADHHVLTYQPEAQQPMCNHHIDEDAANHHQQEMIGIVDGKPVQFRWRTASQLVLGKDRVVCGPIHPCIDRSAIDYALRLDQRQLHLDDVLRLSRLLGNVYAHCIAKGVGEECREMRMSDEFDAKRIQHDIRLLVEDLGVTNENFALHMSSSLMELFQQVCGSPILQLSSSSTLPAFLLQSDCPSAVIREFLGGLSGYLGQPPHLSKQGLSGVLLPVPPSLCEAIRELLIKAGMNAEHIVITVDGVLLSGESLLQFESQIGFRYCWRKQMKLSAAASFHRRQQRLQYDHDRFVADGVNSDGHMSDLCEEELWIKRIGALALFTEAASGTSSSVLSSSYGLPSYHLSVVSRKAVGERAVFDLTVLQGHSFVANGFVVSNCKDDYMNLFVKRCTACSEFILKQCISVNEEYYHPDCLKCDVCHKKLDKYICVAGHLRCSDHQEFACEKFRCFVCEKLIDAEVVLTMGKKLHQNCFKCAFCKTPITKSNARLKNDKLCCQNCLSPTNGEVRTGRSQSVATPGAVASPSGTRNSTGSVSTGKSRRSSEADAEHYHPTNAAGKDDAKNGALDSISEDIPDEVETAVDLKRKESKKDDKDKKSKKASTSSSSDKNEKNHSRKPSKPVGTGTIEWKKGELIGKGSFGKVFMGMNAATGELIAVKQVKLNTDEEHEIAKQIETEITLMRSLRHPNIVSLLDTTRVGNKLNILMEYVPGKSLDTILERFGALNEKLIKWYTKQLLEALAYCHANGVVHRDIKGKNILIDTKGNLKLADFGSAKRFQNVLSKDQPSLSYNYTPLWTAPEVLVGDYNSKVDLWSLGCVIIEMATAKPPWSECNFENPFRALYHIGNSDAIPKIPENISALARDFLLKCLRRNPDERPEAGELLKHEWLQGLEGNQNGEEEEDDEDEEDEKEEDEEEDEDDAPVANDKTKRK